MKPAIGHTLCVTRNTNWFLHHIRKWREVQRPLRLQRLLTGELESDKGAVRELCGNLLVSMWVPVHM